MSAGADIAQHEARARLHQLLAAGKRMVAFTGAGISTEAGVPDFRTPGSPWMINKPIPFEAFIASAEARKEAWRRKFVMDDSYQGAEPAPAHRLLARLIEAGRMQGIITQNIDGLHHAAGTPEDRVIEIHGNGTYATCLDCETRHEIAEIRAHFATSGHAPPCRACGGIVKSATISFGQRMPEMAMRRADALARDCDLFLVMGSSLVVFPAAQLPLVAAASGAKLVILNREPTPLDAHADLVVRGEIGALLAGINCL